MKSRRPKLANLRARHFIRPWSTRLSCHNRVHTKLLVVDIQISPQPPRDRLSRKIAFFECLLRIEGGSLRLPDKIALQKQGEWMAGVGDKAQHHSWWNIV